MLRLILLALSVAAIAQIPAPNIVGGDVPSGASNLTTVGAIPYVSAAGVLNQDPTALFWDAANNRLGVGTASPSTALHVASGTTDVGITLDSSGSGDSVWKTDSSGLTFFGTTNNSAVTFLSSNIERMRVTGSTGNLLIGTTTDSGYKLDVVASGSAWTARFYGGSGVSDTTKVVVQAGGGQSGNLQEWQAANGGVRASVGSFGDFIGSSYDNGGTWEAGSSLNRLSNTYRVQWSSTGSYAGAADLSLSRASAGVLQVGNGGSNANGELQAKIHTWINGTEATCNSATRGEVVMVQGGAGVADTLRVCRKDAADAYAWTALY